MQERVQSRLRRCRRLGHACQPGRRDGLSGRPARRAWAAAWPPSPRDRARRLARYSRGGDLRIRPHLPRERRQGHRPRPRQRLLGAGRRRQGRAHRRRAGEGDEANLFQNRDFPVLTDYRALFGGLIQKSTGSTRRPSIKSFLPQSRSISHWFDRAVCGASNLLLRTAIMRLAPLTHRINHAFGRSGIAPAICSARGIIRVHEGRRDAHDKIGVEGGASRATLRRACRPLWQRQIHVIRCAVSERRRRAETTRKARGR